MTNLERFYRSVHGRDLQPWERQLAVRIAAALNTTTNDDFVVHLLLVYMSTNSITNMYNELVAARNTLAEDNRDLIQTVTKDLRRNKLMTYGLIGAVDARRHRGGLDASHGGQPLERRGGERGPPRRRAGSLRATEYRTPPARARPRPLSRIRRQGVGGWVENDAVTRSRSVRADSVARKARRSLRSVAMR